ARRPRSSSAGDRDAGTRAASRPCQSTRSIAGRRDWKSSAPARSASADSRAHARLPPPSAGSSQPIRRSRGARRARLQATTPDAPQRQAAVAVLCRLHRAEGRERSSWPWHCAKLLIDERERPRFVKLTGNEQDGVIGLIVLMIEGLQALDRNVLDIRAGADRR